MNYINLFSKLDLHYNHFRYTTVLSHSYYIYDLINYSFLKLNDWKMIIHHLLSIIIITAARSIPLIQDVLLWIEISNIPLYISYHLIKTSLIINL